MDKIDLNNYEELLENIKDDRELVKLLIRYLCSKGSIDLREWILFLESEITSGKDVPQLIITKKAA